MIPGGGCCPFGCAVCYVCAEYACNVALEIAAANFELAKEHTKDGCINTAVCYRLRDVGGNLKSATRANFGRI